MAHWKHGFAAALFGMGAVCIGCGGGTERPDPALAATTPPATKGAALATAHFSVEGMTCGGCVIATEMAVRRLAGVAAVDAGFDGDPQRGHATVEYDPARVSVDAIADAMRRVGFTPRLRKPDQGAEASGRPDEIE